MRLKFKLDAPVSGTEMKQERKEYLTSLKEAQVLLLENMLHDIPFQKVRWINGGEEKVIGHIAIKDKKIFELFLTDWHIAYMDDVVAGLVANGYVEKAICKTFDNVFLSACLVQQKSTKVIGHLSRTYQKRILPEIGIKYNSQIAKYEDLEKILSVRQEVFKNRDKIVTLIEKEQIFLFELPRDEMHRRKISNQTIGFGFIQPIVPYRNEVEVGWAVDLDYRNKGYAAYLLQFLCEQAVATGCQPVASTSVDNAPSRKMGQRVGLCTDHCLLEFNFKNEETA